MESFEGDSKEDKTHLKVSCPQPVRGWSL